MALTKETTYDYEITGIGKNIQQKRTDTIYEDGVKLTDSYHRAVYMIGMNLDGIEDETTVKALLWTPQVSASYALMTMSQSLGL